MASTDLSAQIKQYSQQLGFSVIGVATAEPSPRLNSYLRWIEAGMHGEMSYMAREDRVARRTDLNLILPAARTLIMVAMDYHAVELPVEIATDPSRGRISNYAWGADYHVILLEKLAMLVDFIRKLTHGEARARAYVDTGAILERSHAQQAGLGFYGKNTMLIHPRRGSYFFLGEVITTAAIAPDFPAPMPGCGRCTRCLAACPTHAFPEPYVLDGRRCISYLTIEHQGFIARELRPLMHNWVYGCDVCQQVCPWQRFTQPSDEAGFSPASIDRAAPPLESLLQLDQRSFRERYHATAIYRIKRDRLVRNACIAAGNSGITDFAGLLARLLQDGSPLVRGHAAWALGRLRVRLDAVEGALKTETDQTVASELELALAESAD